jgi:hypothetical protein
LNTSIDELLEDGKEKVSSLKQHALIVEVTVARISAVKKILWEEYHEIEQ